MKSILLIEDDQQIIDLYRPALIKAGFKVIEATNGEDGLKQAKTERPDLILLDVSMPDMDGMAVMQQIRSWGDWGKNARIVIFTNFDADDDRLKRIVEYKPSFYLLKADYTPAALAAKISEVLHL